MHVSHRTPNCTFLTLLFDAPKIYPATNHNLGNLLSRSLATAKQNCQLSNLWTVCTATWRETIYPPCKMRTGNGIGAGRTRIRHAGDSATHPRADRDVWRRKQQQEVTRLRWTSFTDKMQNCSVIIGESRRYESDNFATRQTRRGDTDVTADVSRDSSRRVSHVT